MDRREELVGIINSFPLDEDILYLTEQAREQLANQILSWLDEHYEEKKCSR